jgi:uncharacterized protein YbjT (DUF2867 family)
MTTTHKVLLLGGTGRTGGRVLTQLLARGIPVRAIVRSAERLPQGTAGSANLEIIEAEVLALTPGQLREAVEGCDSVISCLGHPTNVRGIFGEPRELVTPVVSRVCDAIRDLKASEPVRLVLMSTVSVLVPDARDARRGAFERAVVRGICALVPPAKDNQRAADYLLESVGSDDPYVEWVAVRPDTLREGDVGEYQVIDGLRASLAKPDDSAMANVAHFMCELATNEATWSKWRCRLPVIVNAT